MINETLTFLQNQLQTNTVLTGIIGGVVLNWTWCYSKINSKEDLGYLS